MNWKAYFKGIKDVCPWSWEAYQDDKILITSFDGVIPLGKYKAIVYTFDQDMDVDYLDILAEYLNHEIDEYEFLWSHPGHTKGGNNQTPTAVLIQQDRKELEYLRQGIKHGTYSKAKETSKGVTASNPS